jgi:antibiotic biosynthesis monooxygenase (ABM) superfamily enzyme
MALEAGRAATGHDGTAGPAAKPTRGPKRWKEFLITVAGVYPLTVLIPIALTWLAHYLPLLKVFVIRGLISATLLVTVLMFALLPLFHKLFGKWLTR